MDPALIASSFALLFLAEMGDKTQLMVMTLAARFRPWPVVLGACAAFLVLDLFAVLVGEALFRYVPQQLVLVVAAVLFLYFAASNWRVGKDDDAEAEPERSPRSVLATSFVLIFVAELGDKTQLTMLTLAASTGSLWSVFTGGTLALWAVTLLGGFVGATLISRLPALLVQRSAAVLFAACGVIALWRALA